MAADGGASAEDTHETGATIDCTGEPIAAPAGEWSWVDVPGTRCGDGSATGLAINPSASGDRLLVFLMGGGGCFTAAECTGPCNPAWQHCAANLDGYDAATAGQELAMFGPGSIFDRTDPDNPFRDDDWVLVPYCTGDFHSGGTQAEYGSWHVGSENLQIDLEHVVPTFCDASSVVLMGSSAGGFGAVFGYALVAEAFGGVRVDLVDDSGPPLSADAMPLQAEMRTAWGSVEHAPPGCPGCGGGWDAYLPWIAATWPDARISLVSSLADPSIGPYFGGPIADPAGFAAAMNAFADTTLAGLSNVRVYYVDEFHHVYAGEDLGGVVSAGVPLATFLRQQLEGDPAWASVRP